MRRFGQLAKQICEWVDLGVTAISRRGGCSGYRDRKPRCSGVIGAALHADNCDESEPAFGLDRCVTRRARANLIAPCGNHLGHSVVEWCRVCDRCGFIDWPA